MRRPSVRTRIRYRLFELWAVTSYHLRASSSWLFGSWYAGWSLVFSRGTVRLLIIVTFVSSLIFARQGMAQGAFEALSWKTQYFNQHALEVFLKTPTFIAQNDFRYVEINVQNGANIPLRDVNVSIRAKDGSLLFKEGNSVFSDLLQPGQSLVQRLPFSVSQLNLGSCIGIQIVSIYDDGTMPGEPTTSTFTGPLMCSSIWRSRVAAFNNLPDLMRNIATIAGYMSSLLAAVVLIFRDQLLPIWRLINHPGNHKNRNDTETSNG